jgi:poly-beta-1,6-N-acetyl-D-glucosamine synthase
VPSLHRLRDLGSGVSFLFVLSFGVLAYTWLGYPALVRLFAWMRKPTSRSDAASATVTVVIASRDDDHTLIERLRNVAESDYPRECLQAVVALDAARTSSNLAASLPDLGFPVTVVQGDLPGGKAGALNAGVRAAHGDTLVFTDSAQRFTSTTIRRLATTLAGDDRLGAVSGALHLEGAPGGGVSVSEWYWRYERWLRYWEARLHSAVGVTGAVYAMRRSLWTPLPAGLILDDLYTPMQLVLGGHRIGFVRDAVAVDARRFSVGDESKRKSRTLTGVLQLCAWLPSVLSPFRNPIWAQFVSHKLLRLLTPLLLALALIGAIGVLFGAATSSSLRLILAIGLGAAALTVLALPRLREMVRDALVMQGSILRAARNAWRGDWDVWHR